jgi:UDP-N-acetyl-D-glucosamine dehydrogenase
VLVLGVTYKRDVEDVRESPAIDIINLLRSKGAEAQYHDPYVPSLQIEEDHPPISTIDLTESAIRSYDAVVIVTDHSSYDWPWIAAHSKLVVDTRNATKNVQERGNIKRL